MKYKKELICLVLYIFIMFFALLSLRQENSAFARILPGTTAGDQVFVLFILYLIMPIIFGILLGYLLTPLYLYVHKRFVGRKMIYGIKERAAPKKSQGILRALFPALMTANFAIMLTPFLANVVLYGSVFETRPGQVTFLTFVILFLFTIGPSFGLFAGVWFLEDAGIGYTNREKVKETGEFVEYRSLGKWYLHFLKGYAGIGVIFTIVYILMDFFLDVSRDGVDFGQIVVLIFIVIPIPIYGTFAGIPTLIIIDSLREKRIKYVIKWANKLGITEELQYIAI